jgi:hypothetical protein
MDHSLDHDCMPIGRRVECAPKGWSNWVGPPVSDSTLKTARHT